MPIHTIYTLFKDDAEARNWLSFFRSHGYPNVGGLVIERVFWLEGDVERGAASLPPGQPALSGFLRTDRNLTRHAARSWRLPIARP